MPDFTIAATKMFALTAMFLAAAPAAAQRRHRPPPDYVQLSPPDQQRGQEVLEEFRRMGIAGDYYLEFELRVLPRRGEGMTLPGRMWGTRADSGPVTRVTVRPGDPAGEVRLLVRGGETPAVWRWRAGESPLRLDAAALFEPVAGAGLTAFDLQLPFLHWQDFVYEGLTRTHGRPAHQFLFYPPPEVAKQNPELTGVRAYLDTQYGGLVKTELIGAEGRLRKTLNLLNFKKVGDQWIVKSLDLFDETTRNKTRFVITAAALNLRHPAKIFEPEELEAALHPPPSEELIEIGP